MQHHFCNYFKWDDHEGMRSTSEIFPQDCENVTKSGFTMQAIFHAKLSYLCISYIISFYQFYTKMMPIIRGSVREICNLAIVNRSIMAKVMQVTKEKSDEFLISGCCRPCSMISFDIQMHFIIHWVEAVCVSLAWV